MKLIRYPLGSSKAEILATSLEEALKNWNLLNLDQDGDIVVDVETGKRYFILVERDIAYEVK